MSVAPGSARGYKSTLVDLETFDGSSSERR